MNRNLEAAGLAALGMTCFTLNDAVVKGLTDAFPIGQIVFLRGLLVVAVFSTAARLSGQSIFKREMFSRWSLARGFCELFATACFLSALAVLPLATATTLVFVSPVLLTVLAAVLLKERVPLIRWAAVFGGFAGVVMIAQPGSTDGRLELLLPVAAAFFIALRDIAVRHVPPKISSLHVSMTTAGIVTTGGMAMSLIEGLRPMGPAQGGFFALAAVFLCGAYFFYVLATRMGDLSFVAPFKYVSIVLAIGIGYLLWGETPSAAMVVGGAVIVVSGLVILFDERRSRALEE